MAIHNGSDDEITERSGWRQRRNTIANGERAKLAAEESFDDVAGVYWQRRALITAAARLQKTEEKTSRREDSAADCRRREDGGIYEYGGISDIEKNEIGKKNVTCAI
ncbi:hypothetical protein Fot_36128 [Forsythia ovata]|uniref:Uncharacterized protein n=1 Tax=Forsythia ovata TaxID=205694 RepID=A0ABD1SNI9_9LAMI